LELGIDAFALNIGPDSWEAARVADAYQAAKQVATITGKVFKLFISFDLSFAFTADQINAYIESYATHPNQFMYQNATFVSTFSGEWTTFGESNINDGWQLQIKNVLAKKGIRIYFVPEWSALDPTGVFKKYPVINGIFSWNAW
jgi:glucan endo-1,3-alpha-glucosidase